MTADWPRSAGRSGTEIHFLRPGRSTGGRLDLAEFPPRLFVYGSLRSGGRLSRLLPGERTLATAWGWTLYGYGPIGRAPFYPVAIRGGSVHVVGEVVEVDWTDPQVQDVVILEVGSGYSLRTALVNVRGVPARCSIFAWERPDDDWIQDRIESGDWLTFEEVGR